MVKTIGIILVSLVAVVVLVFLAIKFVIRPLYAKWGATQTELEAALPGDTLLPEPGAIQTNAITIRAPAEQIWPWLAQMGQEKGGLYSIEWLENLVGCDMHNADRIHPEWQEVKPGDLVRMMPKTQPNPPPYIVAEVLLNQALILGHHTPDEAAWNDTWAFVLQPVDAQTTRLVIRTRTNNVGGIWDVFDAMAFVMQHAMMDGIKERAEGSLSQ
ncbi:MAG: SRPBCC family protein [Chloroflexi bacterium]|nr:SRPBCC family protein [Chloroflexota bacterium]